MNNGHCDKEKRGTQSVHRSLFGVVRPSEYFITTVNRNEWGAHMSWANNHEGKKLREVVTGRFGSTLVISTFTFAFHWMDAVSSCLQKMRVQWNTFFFP
jgi:hypothetical protein